MFFYEVLGLCWAVASVSSVPVVSPAPGVIPLEKQEPTVIPILSQSEEVEANGTYKFSYETGNGIKREETSYDKILPKVAGRSAGSGEESSDSGSEEIHVQQGSYSYTAPDGTVISLRYIADENGFQPIGDHIPKVPSIAQSVASSGSGEKSGRALNTDNASAASVPAALARSADSSSAPAVPVSSSPASSSAPDATSSASEAIGTEAAAAASSNESPKASTTEVTKESSTTEASEPTTSAEGSFTTGAESETNAKVTEKPAPSTSAAESSEVLTTAAESKPTAAENEITSKASGESASTSTVAAETPTEVPSITSA